tara:strand:+ start:67007 stop:67843 length:837 start_codon:yes stop_codon:yes gene_type:complete
MLRQVLACPPQDLRPFAKRPLVWQSRRPQSGPDDLCWSPGDPPPAGLHPHTIVALWGVTAGDGAALAQNTSLALAALDLAHRTGARRVLHLSSAAVYGAPPAPVSETSVPLPSTAYGAAKLAMEHAIADWHAQTRTGPRSTVLRLGNVAGADALFANLSGPLTLDRFAGGQGPSRSYIAPCDLARVIARLASGPLAQMPALLNVAGPFPVAMSDIARAAGVAMFWRDAPPAALAQMHLVTEALHALGLRLPDSASPARLVAQWRTYVPAPALIRRARG